MVLSVFTNSVQGLFYNGNTLTGYSLRNVTFSVADSNASLVESTLITKLPQHERGNALSHALGVILSVVASAFLLVQLSDLTFSAACYGCVIYLLSMLAVYTSSTFYHGWAESEHKEWLHKVDHACVYIFIAGTATPFLTWIGDPSSWSALGVLWAITIVCVYLSLSAFDVSEKYSHWFAGALAILASITVCLLAKCMPFEGILMFMAGVTTYFSGMYFYLNRSIKHHHVLWHMAVLVGSTLHYFTVMLYVLPSLVVL